MLQPGASERPLMTKMAWTPPSLVPLGFFLNRDSRTGPFCVMNQGTLLFAPLSVATATCGLGNGAEPPEAGCPWQDKHWFELKRGPRPLFAPPVTDSMSANRACPS